jgi:hypothetical protein
MNEANSSVVCSDRPGRARSRGLRERLQLAVAVVWSGVRVARPAIRPGHSFHFPVRSRDVGFVTGSVVTFIVGVGADATVERSQGHRRADDP